ncbi:Retrovirus-related Pol polyprotein from transposon TNT 1-94 [Anthophora plagiata]
MSDKEFGMEIVKLDGTNYSTWKFEVVIALEAKDLFGFVDGTTVKPDEDKTTELKAYGQKSAQVKIIILSTIAQNLRRNLYNCSTAKEMWDKLKDLYGEASEDAAQTAWEQFYNFRISETEPIADQLEILESICRRLQDTGEGPSDKAVMTKLLRSLPAKFSIFRHTWECTPVTEKTKTNLISRLIKEDKWIAEDEVATLALHVQKSSLNDAKRKKRSKKDIEEMKKRTRCGVCKEKGHWARECPKRQKDQWEKPSGSSVRNAPALVCDIVETYKCTSEVNSDVWIADSGAGMHMTFRKDYFSVLQSNSNGHMVKVADDRIILAGGIGTIKIQEELEGVSYERELQDVLYVPELKCSLFSIGSINKKRYSFHSFENRCEVRDSEGKLAARGIPHGTLFKMCFKVKVPIECKTIKLADGQEKLKLWHERMGHLNIRAVKHTCEHFGIDGMENDNGINKLFCEGCVMGKQSRRPHPSMRIENNYGPGEKIHTDVCGPVNISSPSNTRFFLLFKDENTSFRKVYFLSHKTEAGETITPFEKWFKRKPVIKHLKMFGSTAYLNIPKEKRQKFDAKSKQVIFVGYEGESTNYRLWDNDLNKIKISSDVTFNESALPRVHPDTVSIKFGIEKEAEIIPVLEDAAEHQVLLDENEENREEWFDAAVQETEQVATNRNVRECRQLRDRRNLQVPDRYGVPIAFFADTVPTTYTEAIMSDDTSKWKRAMDEEMLALEENHTWTLCALPQGKRAIGCNDQCVFVGVVNSSKVYLVLYVDDGLIVSENESAIKRVLNYLESNFKITVDHADEFLGFEIKRDRERRILKICQSGYIKRIIEKFNMSEANPCSVPAEPGMFLPKQTPAVEGKIPYREAIGSLLFAARVCRPDIEYAVNYASQFLSCYDDTHWQAVKKILRYLNGTRDYGIVYGNSKSPLEISGFTDADYAGCITTRKSRSGFVFILNGGPITWSSQLQKVVALSTTESEYIALAHGVKDAIWLRRMLNELDIPCNSVSVYVDNQAAIKIASNSENHKRSKHIDVKYHFTREVVNRGEIEIKYIQSKEQLADIFTKPLQKQQYCYLREKLNVNGHSN